MFTSCWFRVGLRSIGALGNTRTLPPHSPIQFFSTDINRDCKWHKKLLRLHCLYWHGSLNTNCLHNFRERQMDRFDLIGQSLCFLANMKIVLMVRGHSPFTLGSYLCCLVEEPSLGCLDEHLL